MFTALTSIVPTRVSLKTRAAKSSHKVNKSTVAYTNWMLDGVGCSGGDCALPVASAYDHHDGDISSAITIEYAMFVLSDPGCDPVQTNQTLSQSEFDARLQPNAFRGEFVLAAVRSAIFQ